MLILHTSGWVAQDDRPACPSKSWIGPFPDPNPDRRGCVPRLRSGWSSDANTSWQRQHDVAWSFIPLTYRRQLLLEAEGWVFDRRSLRSRDRCTLLRLIARGASCPTAASSSFVFAVLSAAIMAMWSAMILSCSGLDPPPQAVDMVKGKARRTFYFMLSCVGEK